MKFRYALKTGQGKKKNRINRKEFEQEELNKYESRYKELPPLNKAGGFLGYDKACRYCKISFTSEVRIRHEKSCNKRKDRI
ncbi:MAG: hypothetical protein LVQ95_01200 [Candidatus Micrarchaeales archaeon]|nr:hypothetical protein [Candidatus Micrarchaeales archaeon]